MAQNKNAQIRYKALDKCLANRYKKFYINDLIAYCSEILSDHYAQETTVSRRQIFDDIDFMKSEAGYDAPIESIKDGRKVFYRYSDPEFSMLKIPLNPPEMDYYEDQNFSRMEDGRINLWNVFNLFTQANKSSYIDTFLDRNLNAFDFTRELQKTLNGNSDYHWFLS